MDNQILRTLIQTLKVKCSLDDAYFGYMSDEMDEFSYNIKANKEGLVAQTIQLLEASLEIDKRALVVDEIYKIQSYTTLDHSEFLISHVEFVNHSIKKLKKPEVYKETIRDKLSCWFGIAVLVFLIICLIVGFCTNMKWLFSIFN